MELRGCCALLNHLGVTEVDVEPPAEPLYSRSTSWTRVPRSGIVHLDALLGDRLVPNQQLATIYDPFGKVLGRITSKSAGIVIGHTQAPLVNRGDAISHVARISDQPPARSGADTLEGDTVEAVSSVDRDED